MNKWETGAFSQKHARSGSANVIPGTEWKLLPHFHAFRKALKETETIHRQRDEAKKNKNTDKPGKDRNLVRYIIPPLADRAKTFTHVMSHWQNRFIIITLTATPLDLSRPISHHPENRPSCPSSSNVTTFDPRCKTASLINWESCNLPDCATPTGLSTAFWGHTCRNSLFEIPDGNKAQNDKTH